MTGCRPGNPLGFLPHPQYHWKGGFAELAELPGVTMSGHKCSFFLFSFSASWCPLSIDKVHKATPTCFLVSLKFRERRGQVYGKDKRSWICYQEKEEKTIFDWVWPDLGVTIRTMDFQFISRQKGGIIAYDGLLISLNLTVVRQTQYPYLKDNACKTRVGSIFLLLKRVSFHVTLSS